MLTERKLLQAQMQTIKVSPQRGVTVLARRAVAAAAPPTRPAAGAPTVHAHDVGMQG